jgi:hypothetical protein
LVCNAWRGGKSHAQTENRVWEDAASAVKELRLFVSLYEDETFVLARARRANWRRRDKIAAYEAAERSKLKRKSA